MKKKLFFVLLAAFVAINLKAQIFVGGSFEFKTNSTTEKISGTTYDKGSVTHFAFKPKGGYFLSDIMAAGASIGFSSDRISIPPSGTNGFETTKTENLFSFAPFFRYYALEIGQVSVFGEAFVSFGFGGNKTKMGSVTNDDGSVFVFGMGALPGASYKLNQSLDIEVFLGAISYSRNSLEKGNTTTIKSAFNFDLSSEFGVGFVYKF